MFFVAVIFLWFCTGAILYSKYRVILNGKKLQGEIVGFTRTSESTLSFSGYRYVIRFKYANKTLAAESLQTKMGTLEKPPKHKEGERCTVYYNPKYPNKVALAGKYGAEISSLILFLIGVVGLYIYFTS